MLLLWARSLAADNAALSQHTRTSSPSKAVPGRPQSTWSANHTPQSNLFNVSDYICSAASAGAGSCGVSASLGTGVSGAAGSAARSKTRLKSCAREANKRAAAAISPTAWAHGNCCAATRVLFTKFANASDNASDALKARVLSPAWDALLCTVSPTCTIRCALNTTNLPCARKTSGGCPMSMVRRKASTAVARWAP